MREGSFVREGGGAALHHYKEQMTISYVTITINSILSNYTSFSTTGTEGRRIRSFAGHVSLLSGRCLTTPLALSKTVTVTVAGGCAVHGTTLSARLTHLNTGTSFSTFLPRISTSINCCSCDGGPRISGRGFTRRGVSINLPVFVPSA